MWAAIVTKYWHLTESWNPQSLAKVKDLGSGMMVHSYCNLGFCPRKPSCCRVAAGSWSQVLIMLDRPNKCLAHHPFGTSATAIHVGLVEQLGKPWKMSDVFAVECAPRRTVEAISDSQCSIERHDQTECALGRESMIVLNASPVESDLATYSGGLLHPFVALILRVSQSPFYRYVGRGHPIGR